HGRGAYRRAGQPRRAADPRTLRPRAVDRARPQRARGRPRRGVRRLPRRPAPPGRGMSTADPARLAALAGRLDLSPRQLLALLARIAADPDATLDAARLAAECARVRAAGAEAERAAALVLLGAGAYANIDIDKA